MTSDLQTPRSLANLRVGILLDSHRQPRWIEACIREVLSLPRCELALVVINQSALERSKQGGLRRLLARRDHLLFQLFRKLDEALFPVERNAFEKVDLTSQLSGCRHLTVRPIERSYSDYLTETDVAAIRDEKLDVLIRFGFRILRGEILHAARYGVWSYHHGDNLTNRGGPACFWEVVKGESVTGVMLQVLNESLDGGRVLYRSWSKTHPYSFFRNRNRCHWKSVHFIARKLRVLSEYGEEFLKQEFESRRYRPYSGQINKTPGNREMLPILAKTLWRWTKRFFDRGNSKERWSIAFQMNESPVLTDHLYSSTAIEPPPDRFWADPFPVARDGNFYLFVEEFLYSKAVGHIAVIRLAPNGVWEYKGIALQASYHMSYPFLFTFEGELYMIPETRSANRVELYRCTEFPMRWSLEKILLDNVQAVDSTIIQHEGHWWMFTNIAPEGVSVNDELHLFSAMSPFGPWEPHPRNPVKSDVRSARSAGSLFYHNGELYRPSQCGSPQYGSAIVLNVIRRLTPTDFEEEEVSRILPNWRPGLKGVHTINSVGRLTVVDCLAKR